MKRLLLALVVLVVGCSTNPSEPKIDTSITITFVASNHCYDGILRFAGECINNPIPENSTHSHLFMVTDLAFGEYISVDETFESGEYSFLNFSFVDEQGNLVDSGVWELRTTTGSMVTDCQTR